MELAAQKIARGLKRAMLVEARADYTRSAALLCRQLKEGDIEVRAWREAMEDLVKDIHVAAYLAGKSGEWDSMEQKDWGRIGNTLRTQYRFLRGWARELRGFAGEDKALANISLAKLTDRASLYSAAASQSFEQGYGSEIGLNPNVLPAWPGDGTTRCYTRCKCRWAITILSKSRGDFKATWRLGPAEHCRTCRLRARKWRQLEIRGNRLVDGYTPIFD